MKTYQDNVVVYLLYSNNINTLNEHILFLSKCRRSGIIPIRCRIKKKKKKRNASSTTQKVIKTTNQKLLNRLITKKFTKRWRLEQKGKRFDENLSEGKHLNEKNKKLLQKTNETKTRRKGNNRRKEAATIKN